MVQDFKRLDVWKRAKDFCLAVYGITAKFPKEEIYGIIPQLRRAAASIGANIAEGCGRSTNKDFGSFLYNAFGSIKECEYFLILSKDLNYLSENDFKKLMDEIEIIGKMLNRFLQTVKQKTTKNHLPQTTN